MKCLETTSPCGFAGFSLGGVVRLALFAAGLVAPSCFSAPGPEVRLLLDPVRRTVVVGEPVIINLSVTNSGSSDIRCQPLIRRFGYTKFFVGIVADDTECGLPFVKDPVSSPARVAPGDVRTEQEVLHFNFKNRQLAFSRPGQYTLHAKYRGMVGAETTLSAETVIIVRAPQPDEAEGSALFGDEDVGALVAGTTRAPQVISRLQAFVQKAPASRFALYSALLLAEHELRIYGDKPANPVEAARLLRISDVPGFPLRPVVRLRKAEAALFQGRPADALAEVQEVLQGQPGSDLKAQAEKLQKQAETAVRKPRPEP